MFNFTNKPKEEFHVTNGYKNEKKILIFIFVHLPKVEF